MKRVVFYKDAYVNKCNIDEKNSIRPEKQTRLDPGHPGQLSLKISEIVINDKVKNLKNLQTGNYIKFKIFQEIVFFTKDEQEEFSRPCEGIGYGKVLEILSSLEFEHYDDEEEEEVTITLSEGFAEDI